MISGIRTCTIALSLIAATAISIQLSAQDNSEKSNRQPRYKLIDLGTFGGPNSLIVSEPPQFRLLNNQGTVVSTADTSTSDPYFPHCALFCFVDHAFQWQRGVLTDLGALPGVNSSIAFGTNELGMIAGLSENGSIDPLTGFPEYDAVVWGHGTITNLGTFGGNISEALAVNDWGQVAGAAANTIPDNYATYLGPCVTLDCWPVATQYRAFLWQNGRKQDLGTLGGNDAAATMINDLGMVAGVSYTDSTPNPTTGIPTMHPFLWVGGRMWDLGSLGGTLAWANWLNLRGQAVGASKVAGDQWDHPFLWSNGSMQDLGTLGGSGGIAYWINDLGAAVGFGNLQGDQAWHGVLWTAGKKTDLGTVDGDPCSFAFSINLKNQIVGSSGTCASDQALHAFLWENGTIYDLNALVPVSSDLTMVSALNINDKGEITGNAVLSNGDTHAFLAAPCEVDDPGGCQSTPASEVTTHADSGPIMRLAEPGDPANQLRKRFGQHSDSGRPSVAP
jgi:probable HAF family extracellular repeat protein